MADSLDIADVARLTGLTSRALRFYEARGLIAPLRTASGRRHYGPAELERLHQIMALKRAGLSLAQIQRLTRGRTTDLRALVSDQLDALDAQAREIREARTLLATILSRIDRSEPIDVATFCSLIRQGELTMSWEKWTEVRSRYMSQAQLAEAKELHAHMPPGFDQQAHNAKWADLIARIKAALPMDPASPQAQAFLDEWQALIQPFLDAASPELKAGFRKLYAHYDEWQAQDESGMDPEVFRFHQQAAHARAERQWAEIRSRYMSAAQLAEAKELRAHMPPGFDPQVHNAQWADLMNRIRAALPMDPASPQAQAFLDEWQALTQPYLDAASPDLREGFRNLYAHYEEWHDQDMTGMDLETFRFHLAAQRAREAMQDKN